MGFTLLCGVMEKRLLKRGETSGRSDDNAESIKKRCCRRLDSLGPQCSCGESAEQPTVYCSPQSALHGA